MAAIIIILLTFVIAIPCLSVNGQINYSSQGSLVTQVLCPPITDWQTSQQYDVTFQIMANGTVNLPNGTGLEAGTYPDGLVDVDVQITTVVTQYFSGSSYTYDANGSYILSPAWTNILGNSYPASNVTEYDIQEITVPTSNQWQTIESESEPYLPTTCYYQPPVLQNPNALLTQVAIQFTINVYEDLETNPDVILYYLGANLGSSQTVIPLYSAPTPTPTPSPSSTPSLTPTPTASPSPTSSPTPTLPNGTQNPTPTPSIPEYPSLIVLGALLLIATVSSVAVVRLRKCIR